MASSRTSPAVRAVYVGLLLTALWGLYAQATKPLLTVDRKRIAAPKDDFTKEKSAVFADSAAQWFPEDPWVRDEAKGRFRDGGRMLYFRQHQLMNDNKSVLVKPIALLWQDDPNSEDPPITATADSAQLDTVGKFNLGEGNFGPITSGLLAGDVRITGPDGLRIEGRNFYISEGSMKIWTGLPVRFAWGTHSGSAEAGAEIELLTAPDAKQPGLMSVSDVRSIRLLGRVVCNLAFVDEDKDREPILLRVDAAKGFDFDVPTREATFRGFADKKHLADNQIRVERPMPDGGKDLLYCSRLVLQLQPKIRESKPGRSTRMELARITAEGMPVYYSSQKDGLESIYASMRLLMYDIGARTLELREGTIASTGERIAVNVHQGGRELLTGRVIVSLDDDNKVQAIECRGPGEIGESDRIPADEETDAQPFTASWIESLLITQGDDPRVVVSGEAKIEQAATDLGLRGDLIEMILKRNMRSVSKVSEDSDSSLQNEGLDLGDLRPERLTVTGNVMLSAKDLIGKAREKLVVTFQSTAEGVQAPKIRTVSDSEESSESSGETSKLTGKTAFLSDTIEAVALVPEEGNAEFRNVWLKGHVKVTHKSEKAEQGFTAEGNSLFAKNGFDGDREITLYGDPASIVRSSDLSDRIEGEQIDLADIMKPGTAPQRSVTVKGSGRIRFVVPVGLDGKLQEKPSFLDIYWGESMTFSGRTAHFVGSIRAVMTNKLDQDVQLKCDGLKVHFTDEVLIQKSSTNEDYEVAEASDSKSPVGQIERIECEDRVIVDIDMMEQGKVTAHHHAEFSDLVFNQVTGEFHATGPGMIESTVPNEGRGSRLTSSPRASAKANVPAKATTSSFVYIQARFIGELTGNQQKGFVQLRQHVRGVFGPVRELSEKLSIDGLGVEELPENTGSLGCENLSISQILGTADSEPSFSLVAECNPPGAGSGTRSPCRLESLLLSGDADKITYDHSKHRYLLKAEDGRQANVSHRTDNGQRGSFVGRQFAYDVDTNELTAHEITGVQASE